MRTLHALAALALAAAPATTCAKTFTLLIFEQPADFALRTDRGTEGQRYWADYAAFGEQLRKAGVLRGGAALDAPSVVQPLIMGGYFTIETPTSAAAQAFADQAPATRRGGRVEVRANLAAMTAAN